MTLKRQHFHTTAHFYLSMLIAFFLPLARLVPVLILLMILNWLIEGGFGTKFKKITSTPLALIFCLFYILHLVGLFYTENMKSGSFDIQVKLSLLLFPVIYASKPLQEEKLKPVFLSLTAGAVMCSVILLTRAVATYLTTGANNFFYESFSAYLIHPSYLAMYINVAVCWILIQLQKKEQAFGKFSKSISIALILYFSFILVLLSSKLGLLTLAIIYLVALVYYSRKKYIIGLTALILCLGAGFSIVKFVPAVHERIKTATDALTTPANNADSESTAVRMLIWKAASQVISENFLFGTGTGDSKDELIKKKKKRGMTGAVEHRLNAHNEFYQVFVAVGLIGFSVFLLQLLIPLLISIRERKSIYMSFLLILMLNFLTESMLEAEAGVIFYAFFNSILCFSFFPKELNLTKP